MVTHSSTLVWKIPWTEEPGRLQSMGSLSWTRLSAFTFTFHFHALEKEMATHSSVLAWRIPGTGEPGGLPSMGSRRVGHDWSDLAAAYVCVCVCVCMCVYLWLICVVVQWKPAQRCNYPSIKKKKIKLFPNFFDQDCVTSLKQWSSLPPGLWIQTQDSLWKIVESSYEAWSIQNKSRIL